VNWVGLTRPTQFTICHEDYLLHLYDLFGTFCSQGPKIQTPSLLLRHAICHLKMAMAVLMLGPNKA
jgi:hypothetical protein